MFWIAFLVKPNTLSHWDGEGGLCLQHTGVRGHRHTVSLLGLVPSHMSTNFSMRLPVRACELPSRDAGRWPFRTFRLGF
jgi:hypothetical protein